jgi:dihydroorotase
MRAWKAVFPKEFWRICARIAGSVMSRAVDTIICGGTIVTPEQSLRADLLIRDGVVLSIEENADRSKAGEVIDATGLHVLPGIIDAHVHLRDPGDTDKEDWATGTAAAACGGVTTVFDMPSTNPPVDNVAHLRIKQDIAARNSYVDYAIYGLLGGNNLDDLGALSEHGVVGFKCFMSSSLSGRLPAPDDGVMLEGFKRIAALGKRCVVHAENLGIITYWEKALKAAGREDPRAHPESRPAIAAAEAVSRAILFAKHAGMKLHIAHESSADALPYIAEAKASGVDVTVETCPQYLLLNADDLARLGGVLRCNPPIREKGHDAALWAALQSGLIDMLATDHAPHKPEEKTRKSIWDNHCGMLGLETAVPLMLTEVNNQRLTLNRYVELTSANPARIWDLYPRKGALMPGSDADVALVDMNKSAVIDQERLHSKSRISGWHGRRVTGLPVRTIVRGRTVMIDGELVGRPGWGRDVQQSLSRNSGDQVRDRPAPAIP